jgi:hypothetical protein
MFIIKKDGSAQEFMPYKIKNAIEKVRRLSKVLTKHLMK